MMIMHGFQRPIAAWVGISVQRFNDYLHGRRFISPKRAKELADACRKYGHTEFNAKFWMTRSKANIPVEGYKEDGE